MRAAHKAVKTSSKKLRAEAAALTRKTEKLAAKQAKAAGALSAGVASSAPDRDPESTLDFTPPLPSAPQD